jgi:hypothetical protein
MNGVYCLTFPNGKRYVGKSINKGGRGIEHRWSSYRNPNPKKKSLGMGKILMYALLRYGPENVKFEVIYETNDHEKALKVEKQLVALWGLKNRKFGYNYFDGGQLNGMTGRTFKMTEAGREKLRQHNLGRKAPEWARLNMSLAHKGVWTPPRRVITIRNIETGVEETGGVKELSRKCGISAQHISTRGKSKGWILVGGEPKGEKFGNGRPRKR